MSGRWLAALAEARSPAFELVCLPWAGGGASGFRCFSPHLGKNASLWAVAPPGRDRRLTEPPERDLDRWVEAIGREIAGLSGAPVVLLGHSFGAADAFELAHWLERNRPGRVRLLCVSSRRAPGKPSPAPDLAHTGEEALVSWMRTLGGVHQDILSSAEMLELVLPPLRDDLLLDRSYEPQTPRALDIPMLAFAGSEDPIAPPAVLHEWRSYAGGPFACHVLQGGHFSIQQQAGEVMRLIRAALHGDEAASIDRDRIDFERHRGYHDVQAH